MRRFIPLLALAAIVGAGPVHALTIDFETLPGGLTATPGVQGNLLDNSSEINDEISPLRITSGGVSSDPADTFGSIAGIVSLAAAHSGTNAVAGLEGGSGGPGLNAVIDFTQFVEVRILDSGYTFISEWIELFGGATAQVRVCGDLNCGDVLFETTISSSQLFSFTADPGDEIRNLAVIPVVQTAGGGMWIDDITIERTGNGNVPEPGTVLLLGIGIATLALRRRLR